MKKILLSTAFFAINLCNAQIYTDPTTGYVGIGTTEPWTTLDVNGGITTNHYYLNRKGDYYSIIYGFGDELVFTNNSEWKSIIIDVSDNHYLFSDRGLGIGTTTPQAKLDVAGKVLLGGPASNLDYTLTPLNWLQNSAKLLMGWNRSGGKGEIDFIGNRGTGSSGGFHFYDYSNTGVLTDLLSMNGASGNVGIGTTNPQAKLSVYDAGPVGSNQFELRSNHLRNPDRYFMKNIIGGTGSDDVTFSLRHDGQMFVGGNVGIGTTTPQAKLDVRGGGIMSSLGADEGASISLVNPNKNSSGIGRMWTIYNMTGGYGNSLQFWAYDSNGHLNNGYTLKIGDNGNMSLKGKFEATEVKVTTTPTADFVFAQDYALPKLEDVEKFVTENKHLPEVASAEEMKREGVNIGEFQIKLLQKIEELTLYSIEQNKKLASQNSEIKEQNKKIETLQSQNQRLQSQLSKIDRLERQLQKRQSENQ